MSRSKQTHPLSEVSTDEVNPRRGLYVDYCKVTFFCFSFFCFPTTVSFPPNWRLPRPVRKHYSRVFAQPKFSRRSPSLPRPRSPSPHLQLMKTIREERAVSGRACWGGNKGLRGSGEEASNVVTGVKLWHGAQSADTHLHTRTHTHTQTCVLTRPK